MPPFAPVPMKPWLFEYKNLKLADAGVEIPKYLYCRQLFTKSSIFFFFLQNTQRLHKIEHVNANYRNYLDTAYQVNAISVVSIVTL